MDVAKLEGYLQVRMKGTASRRRVSILKRDAWDRSGSCPADDRISIRSGLRWLLVQQADFKGVVEVSAGIKRPHFCRF